MTRDVALCNPGTTSEVLSRPWPRGTYADCRLWTTLAVRGMLSLGDMALLTDDAFATDMLNAVPGNLRSSQSSASRPTGVVLV